MDSIVKLNAQTAARDKLFRLCQYSSRLIWAVMEKYKTNNDVITKLKHLESQLSTARKLFRFGRSMDIMYSSLQTLHLPDPTLRLTITFSRIASSLYLLCDHMLWFNRSGLFSVNVDQWSKWSNKFWLYSITMNLVRDFYEIVNIVKLSRHSNLTHKHYFSHPSRSDVIAPHSTNDIQVYVLRVINWIVKHRNVSCDTLKNFCDFWLPLNSLGHVKLSPAMIGFLGTVSSVISIMQILDYSYRLSPS